MREIYYAIATLKMLVLGGLVMLANSWAYAHGWYQSGFQFGVIGLGLGVALFGGGYYLSSRAHWLHQMVFVHNWINRFSYYERRWSRSWIGALRALTPCFGPVIAVLFWYKEVLESAIVSLEDPTSLVDATAGRVTGGNRK